MLHFRAGLGLSSLAILALATSAVPLQAEPTADTPTIRVVNNHQSRVAVFVVGTDGQRHYVGTVNRTRFKEFTVPATLVQAGERLTIQVFPRCNPAGLAAWGAVDRGIQTRPIEVGAGSAIQLFVEPDLGQSSAGIDAG